MLPLANPPGWYGGLPARAYLAQADAKALPYQWLVPGLADQDGYDTAYSLNTRVLEAGAVDQVQPVDCHQKRAHVMRPWGTTVAFDFPWDGTRFSSNGYPMGINSNRNYVLVDCTPSDHEDKAFELRFAGGICHIFSADGSLSNIRGPDGYSVEVGGGGSSLPWASMTLLSDPDALGPVAATDRVFGVDVSWSRGAVSGLAYRPLGTSTSFAVSITRDQEKGITEVSKQGELAESGFRLNRESRRILVGADPIRTYEQSVTGAGGGRTIERSWSFPGIGTLTLTETLDARDRITRQEVSVGGGSPAVTTFSYPVGDDRYANGFRKGMNPSRVDYPDDSYREMEYSPTNGWVTQLRYPSAAGLAVEQYAYTTHDAADHLNPSAPWEFPRTITRQVGGAVVSGTLSVRTPTLLESQDARTLPPRFGRQDNYVVCITRPVSGITAGLPTVQATPEATNSRTWTASGSELACSGSASYGDTVQQRFHAGGAVLFSEWRRNGQLADQTTHSMDHLGRLRRTSFLDGTWIERSDYTLDGPARLTSSDGTRVEIDYNALGLPSERRNLATGITESYSYDPAGRVLSQTESAGSSFRSISGTWNALGEPLSVTTPLGTTTWTHETVNGKRRSTASLPYHGSTVVVENYLDGALAGISGTGVSAPLSDSYALDQDKIVLTRSAGGLNIRVWHNALGSPERIQRPGASESIRLSYDDAERLVSTSDEAGEVYRRAYDARGDITAVGYDRNGDGRLNSGDRYVSMARTSEANGLREICTAYAPSSAPDEILNAFQRWDATGLTLQRGNKQTTWQRQAFTGPGRYTLREDCSDGSRREYRFDDWSLDREDSFDAGSGLACWRTFDRSALKDLTAIDDSARGTTTIHRDPQYRVTQVADPDGLGLTVSYDGASLLEASRRGRDGQTRLFEYLNNGLVRREYGDAPDRTWLYDSLGRPVSLSIRTNATTITTSWAWDSNTGLLSGKTIAQSAASESYTYTANRKLATVRRGDGRSKTISWDGPVATGISYSDGTPGVTMACNSAGQATALVSAVSLARNYNSEGDLAGESLNWGGVAHAYARGLRVRTDSTLNGVALPPAFFGRDLANRLTNVNQGPVSAQFFRAADGGPLTATVWRVNGQTALTRRMRWENNNRRLAHISYINAAGAVVASFNYAFATNSDRIESIVREDGSVWTYTYATNQGALVAARWMMRDGSTHPLGDFAYEWDDMGNLGSGGLRDTNGVVPWAFKASDLLVHTQRMWGTHVLLAGLSVTDSIVTVGGTRARRAGPWFTALPAVSNLQSAVSTGIVSIAVRFDPTQQLDVLAFQTTRVYAARSVEDVGYDMAGRLARDSRWTYGWDCEGRLTSLVSVARTPILRIAYTYDPAGRRVSSRTEENGQGIESRRWIPDGWRSVAETIARPGQTQTNVYLWGLDMDGWRDGGSTMFAQENAGIGGLLAVVQNGRVLLPIVDHVGAVHMLMNATNQQICAQSWYSPFGEVLGESGEAEACPFRFNTKRWERRTGLYDYGYRNYDSRSAKWLTLDPLGEQGGINLTAFCLNDPVNNIDPLGLAGYFFGGTGNSLTAGRNVQCGDPLSRRGMCPLHGSPLLCSRRLLWASVPKGRARIYGIARPRWHAA